MKNKGRSGSDTVHELPDKGKSCAQGGGVLPQRAEVQESDIFFEGIACHDVPLQDREITLKILAQESPDDNVAVQDHPDVIDAGSKMAQHIKPECLVLRDVPFQPCEKFVQGNAQTFGDAPRGAVGLQASALSAAAGKTSRLHADMPEFPAPAVVAFIRNTAELYGASDTILQRKVLLL